MSVGEENIVSHIKKQCILNKYEPGNYIQTIKKKHSSLRKKEIHALMSLGKQRVKVITNLINQ